MRLLSAACLAWLATVSCVAAGPAARPTVEEMAAHMLMVGFRGAEAGPGSPIARHLADGVVANVILFDKDMTAGGGARNIVSPEQLAALTKGLRKAAAYPLWIGIDQEGGAVRRLRPDNGFRENYPSAASLGKGSAAGTRAVAARIGAELAELGVDIDFAPVADVDVNPASPAIGAKGRSFGADPAAVAAHAIAYGEGLAGAGVIPCLKHFPGHGGAGGDTHAGAVDVTSTWSGRELLPYRLAFTSGWRGAVMTSHVFHAALDPDCPASLSRAVTAGLLRGVLGWNGLIVTDDLHMGAVAHNYSLEDTIRLAVNAGADLLVFSCNARDIPFDPDFPRQAHAALVGMVRRGEIPEARLYESWRRIVGMKTGKL